MWDVVGFINGNGLDNGKVIEVESRCGLCGHKLEDPVSIARGIGPDCAQKPTGSKILHSSAFAPQQELPGDDAAVMATSDPAYSGHAIPAVPVAPGIPQCHPAEVDFTDAELSASSSGAITSSASFATASRWVRTAPRSTSSLPTLDKAAVSMSADAWHGDWRYFTVDLKDGSKEMVCADDLDEAREIAQARWGGEVGDVS